jgi:hypothetical protein
MTAVLVLFRHLYRRSPTAGIRSAVIDRRYNRQLPSPSVRVCDRFPTFGP